MTKHLHPPSAPGCPKVQAHYGASINNSVPIQLNIPASVQANSDLMARDVASVCVALRKLRKDNPPRPLEDCGVFLTRYIDSEKAAAVA